MRPPPKQPIVFRVVPFWARTAHAGPDAKEWIESYESIAPCVGLSWAHSWPDVNALVALSPARTLKVYLRTIYGFSDFSGLAYVSNGIQGYGPKKSPKAAQGKVRSEKY